MIILKRKGLVRDLNPGPLAPKARIIPLDQQATSINIVPINPKINLKHPPLDIGLQSCDLPTELSMPSNA